MLDLHSLKKQFIETGVIIAYNGYLSHEVLTNIVQALEKKIGDLKLNNLPVQDIFTVLIEMLQNIINYYAIKQEQSEAHIDCEGIFVLGIDPDKNKLFLKSGNSIPKDEAQRITEKIDSINHLSKEDLRLKYRELRKSRKQKSARGAGLGFLEIQRRATESIQYSFTDLDVDNCLFVLDVYL